MDKGYYKLKFEELNLLTQKLLTEGYTAENHPNWVKLPGSCFGGPLDNLRHGFVYNWEVMPEKNFLTPCGLSVKRSSCIEGMSFAGKEWCIENDLAQVHCPFHKRDCNLLNEDCKNLATHQWGPYCIATMTDAPYDPGHSIEHFYAVEDVWREELRKDFIARRNGHVCYNFSYYDPDAEKWKIRPYDPDMCAYSFCAQEGFCSFLQKKMDTQKGNVFYDVKIRETYPSEKGTLFEGTIHETVIKGIKYFRKPVNMFICENFVKMNGQKKIRDNFKWNHSTERVLANTGHGLWEFEILNVRAARKETRDIHQDLADIRAGIKVVHENDAISDKKAKKKARRMKRIEDRKKSLRMRFIQGKELSYPDIRFIEKYVTDDESEEWGQAKETALKEKEPVQMTLFDFGMEASYGTDK